MKPLLLGHLVWMEAYRGELLGVDPGTWNHPDGDNPASWHERFNFEPVGNEYRGSIFHWIGSEPDGGFANLDLSRIGGGDDEAHGVTVVWTARNPKTRERVVVGWFEEATVYRSPKEANGRTYYCVSKQATLLPLERRTKVIKTAQSHGRGHPGRSSVFYASDANPSLSRQLLRYIEEYDPKVAPRPAKKSRWSPDPEARSKVELAAMSAVASYLQELGWSPDDVSADCKGWDLECTRTKKGGNTKLYVEVKGTSGPEVAFELTPNEYDRMSAFCEGSAGERSCIAVVTEALHHPRVHAFLFKKGEWKCDRTGKVLELAERTGARGNAR
jgi:hypothetical protein